MRLTKIRPDIRLHLVLCKKNFLFALCAALLAGCVSFAESAEPKTVYLQRHTYPGSYADDFRVSDRIADQLVREGKTPSFEISGRDLKKLYPDYAPSEDAPLVGVLFNREETDYAIPLPYIYALAKAGARIRVISFDGPAEQARGLDGILLSGGDFAWPKEIYARLQSKDYPLPGKRYQAYATLVRYAAESQMPLLGICAGMQAMGVLLGEGRVKLHENLSEVTSYSHRSVPAVQKAHAVSVLSDSRLAAITGAETLDVNSRHFQGLSVSSLEQTSAVRAVAFSSDGVVEAVEFPLHPNFIAVQFHPEVSAWKGDELSQRIVDAFVQDARAYKTQKR